MVQDEKVGKERREINGRGGGGRDWAYGGPCFQRGP